MPTENLSALSETKFQMLDHLQFPHHSVWVKKSKFCNGTMEYSVNLINDFDSRTVNFTYQFIHWIY